MKIDIKLEKAIYNLIHLEWAISQSLIDKATYLENTPFKDYAKWMKKRGEKEHAHALYLFEYLKKRVGKLELNNLKKAENLYPSPFQVFQSALKDKHEVISSTIDLYALAVELKDTESEQVFHAFINEHISEEKHIFDIHQKIKLTKNTLILTPYLKIEKRNMTEVRE
ncbi:ferritin-like domain-containing protein [Aquimarina muelleri]|uniref:Ferritin n=1 Tax=Aquimarina muelleri TaxID=279356 RepID=A0A918JWB5_9FLAO|nr:ferritin-like domain-containing protein [Aquimarina muelleri]MCX2762781.1 ferritin-like domain-containing protein [Aquimarina muelleri]GGX19069.1 hypothetical protein GCM10007384_20510 [Aquimarina muelleri]